LKGGVLFSSNIPLYHFKTYRLVTYSGKRAEKEILDVQRDTFSNWQVFPNPHDSPLWD
jgi:hypothetical protein